MIDISTTIPQFNLNLNDTPRLRWKHIVKEFIPELQEFREQFLVIEHKELGYFKYLVRSFLSLIPNISQELSQEIHGIVDGIEENAAVTNKENWSYIDLLILNFGYDFLAKCTSAIYRTADSKLIHLRNMDWDIDVLKKLTIRVNFMKDNRVLYSAITWVGFVGLHTACNEHCSVSINYRKENLSILRNVWQYMIKSKSTSMLLRNSFDAGFCGYQMYNSLTQNKVIAPCYYILRGQHDGVIITRSRNKYKSHSISYWPWEKSSQKLKFIVQTNHDEHLTTIDHKWAAGDELLLNSLDRKLVMESELRKLGSITSDDMSKLLTTLQVAPIHNRQTIYSCILW